MYTIPPPHHVDDGLRGSQHDPSVPGVVDVLLHRDVPGRQTDPGREGGPAQADQPAVCLPPESPLLLPRRDHLRPPAGPAAPGVADQDPPAGQLQPGVVPRLLHPAPHHRRQARRQSGPGPGPGLDETP